MAVFGGLSGGGGGMMANRCQLEIGIIKTNDPAARASTGDEIEVLQNGYGYQEDRD